MNGVLAQKVAIITGAASGIGRASAMLFAREGAAVVAADIASSIMETAEAITQVGGRSIGVKADTSSEADVAKLVELAREQYGGLDIVFANAGIVTGLQEDFFDLTVQTWMETLRVNLVGPFLAVKHAAPAIRERGGGSIICTASVAGLRSGAGPAPYSASKAGVINLVQTSAQELAGSGVRVNAICPGLIETGMTRSVFEQARAAGKEDRIGQLNPMLRGGKPEEVAAAALFLASPAASYLNGHALVVDGGLSSSHPTAVPAGNRKRGRGTW